MTKPYITLKHIIIEVISYIILLMSFITALIGVITIEGPIITNYGANGEATGYGPVGTLFVPPTLMLLTMVILSATSHFGKEDYFRFRHPVRPEKKLIALSNSVMMIFLLGLIMAIYILTLTIMMTLQQGKYILPITIGMTIATMAIIIAMSIKLEKDIK